VARAVAQNRRFGTQNYADWLKGGLVALLVGAVIGFAPAIALPGIIGGLVLITLILRRPVWGAYVLVLSVPIQKAITLPAGITVTQVLFALVLVIWWLWLGIRAEKRLFLTPIGVAFLFFLVGMLPSLWHTSSMPESLAEISRWTVTILAYIIIVNSVQTRGEMNGLVAAMLVAGSAEAALGLMQAYSLTGPASFIVDDLLTRAYGTIGAPNSFAGYINMSLPLALALAVYFWGRWFARRRQVAPEERITLISLRHLWKPLFLTGVTLLLFYAVLTTLSRGAWVGLSAGVLVMVLSLGKRAGAAVAAIGVGILLLVGLASAGALPSVISERFDQLTGQIEVFDPRGLVPTPENYALMERMVHWQVAGNMFLAYPWTGVGIGNFNELFDQYGVQGWPYSRGHAHNYYLHMLGETGVIGFTFYMVMLITALVVGIKALRRVRARDDTYGEAVVLGALGILVTLMVHNIFENLHALNMGIHWVAALALFTLVGRGQEQTVEGPEIGAQQSRP
jgi:O-antigen ligase